MFNTLVGTAIALFVIMKTMKYLIMIWKMIVYFISAEWILKFHDNGGAIIIFRSLFCSTILYFSIIIFLNFIESPETWVFSSEVVRKSVIKKFTYFGALFGAIYIALYTRFASQWVYLADLYNIIKRTSCTKELNEDMLAEWQAGFIEDAEHLHLYHKENFAPIIKEWGNKNLVREKYKLYTPGGIERLNNLLKKVNKRVNKIHKKHSSDSFSLVQKIKQFISKIKS